MRQFFGKYRGKVTSNQDPLRIGRVQVAVPAIFGEGSAKWAMPSFPYAGQNIGFYAIPPLSADIWVEFEGGNPDFPIWSGCFWVSGQTPSAIGDPEIVLFKTSKFEIKINNNDGSEEITVQTTGRSIGKITIKPDAIELNLNPTILKLLKNTGIELSQSPQAIKLTSTGVEISCAGTTTKVAAGNIDLTSAMIKINGQGGVNINNGALEVI